MTRKELETRVAMLREEIKQQYPNTYKLVQIYKVGSDFDEEDNEYGINWSACGTMNTEFTKQFIEMIKYATEQLEEINKLGKEEQKVSTPINIEEKAVKIIADDFEESIVEDYENWYISNWSEMLNAFGWDRKDAKEEIKYLLEENDIYLFEDDYSLETRFGIVTYRELTNDVKRELKARGVFKRWE